LTMAALIAASGLASPLALLVAGAAMLCCAVAYHRLNAWQASAEAPVKWVARGLSPILGFAVLISITFCTLWVIFLFVCLQGLASSSAISANASNVLPFLAGRLGPKAFADLVALAVIASFATTIQSQIVDGSRIMFGMGRDRTVPKALGRVNPRFRTPVAGLIVMGVIPVLALVLYLASGSLQKTIIYIDSTGGLLFAGYYVVISLYSIWYYRTVLFRDLKEFTLGLLLPLVGAATLVYVIVKSLPGTPVPVRIIALVKAHRHALPQPAGDRGGGDHQVAAAGRHRGPGQLRQDRTRLPDGAGQRGHPGARRHRRVPGACLVGRFAAGQRQRLVAAV